MFRLLFVSFLTIPLLELYVLIRVGGLVGPLMTIVLCLMTAAIGAALLRYQGIQTIARIQQKVDAGEVPAQDMLEGAILLFSGVLLLTPGFVTDVVGFLCLTPAIRSWAARAVLGRHFQYRATTGRGHSVTVEGEYWEEDNRHSNRPLPPK